VRFNVVSEVRVMDDAFAFEASLARLPYKEYLRAERALRRQAMRLSARTVAKLALVLCSIVSAATAPRRRVRATAHPPCSPSGGMPPLASPIGCSCRGSAVGRRLLNEPLSYITLSLSASSQGDRAFVAAGSCPSYIRVMP